MSDVKYIKLSDLVDGEFTVEKVFFPQYKMWDNDAKKMLVSERWEQGYRKIYGVVTDKGTLDMSASQIGNMLEGVSKGGEAKIVGRTFKVKSNGKTGMEIRYYINPTKEERQTSEAWENVREVFSAKKEEKETVLKDIPDEPIDLSEIPF
jgi:hypothetical protein